MAAETPLVSIAHTAINRRLEANGHDGVFLLVKATGAKGSPPELLAQVEQAMKRANDSMTRAGQDVVWAEAAVPTPKGPLVNLDWIGEDEENRQWLENFATELATLGVRGTVTAAAQANLSEAFQKFVRGRHVSAFVALKLTAPEMVSPRGPSSAAWRVHDSTTRQLCRAAVTWGSYPGATVYLSEDISQYIVDSPDVADDLAKGIRRSGQASVLYATEDPPRSRTFSMLFNGCVAYQERRAGASWTETVNAIREPMLQRPTAIDLAFVRIGYGFGHWLALIDLPYVRESLFRRNRALWGEYVPDVNGIQVVSGAHLEKAHDLSGWNVTELTTDRYLVEAPDLVPWYSTETPDADVVAEARADFGEMIMTEEAIRQHPLGSFPGPPAGLPH